MDRARRHLLLLVVALLAVACAVPVPGSGSGGVEVGSTTVPGSPPPIQATPSSTPEPWATVLPHGSYRFPIGEAGVATVGLTDAGAVLEHLDPATGWMQVPGEDDADDGRIQVRLSGPEGAAAAFIAERESDGTLLTRVRESTAAIQGQRTITSGDAGSITFTVSDDDLRVDDARANNAAGWHVVNDDLDDDGFIIALANSGRSTGINISVELDDGRLEAESRTRIGPSYRSGLHDEEPAPAVTPRPPARPTPTEDDDDDDDDDDDEPDPIDRGNGAESQPSADSAGSVDSVDSVDPRESAESVESASSAD